MLFLYLDSRFFYNDQGELENIKIEDLKHIEKKYNTTYGLHIMLVRQKIGVSLSPVFHLSPYPTVNLGESIVGNALNFQLLGNNYPRKHQKYINKKYIAYITSDEEASIEYEKNNISTFFISIESYDIEKVENYIFEKIETLQEHEHTLGDNGLFSKFRKKHDVYLNSPVGKRCINNKEKVRIILQGFFLAGSIFFFNAYFIYMSNDNCDIVMQLLRQCDYTFLSFYPLIIQFFVSLFSLLLGILFFTGGIMYGQIFIGFGENYFLALNTFHLGLICFLIYIISYYLQKSSLEKIRNIPTDSQDYGTFQEFKKRKKKKGTVICIIIFTIISIVCIMTYSKDQEYKKIQRETQEMQEFMKSGILESE